VWGVGCVGGQSSRLMTQLQKEMLLTKISLML
jgi:hypothetical protein